MKNIFKPEDFSYLTGYQKDKAEKAAKLANEKLNKFIESWPIVYGKYNCMPQGGVSDWIYRTTNRQYDKHTHTARLAFIEEIKKEPCKHEPEIILGNEGFKVSWPVPFQPNIYKQIFVKVKCKHCGVELQAPWSERK